MQESHFERSFLLKISPSLDHPQPRPALKNLNLLSPGMDQFWGEASEPPWKLMEIAPAFSGVCAHTWSSRHTAQKSRKDWRAFWKWCWGWWMELFIIIRPPSPTLVACWLKSDGCAYCCWCFFYLAQPPAIWSTRFLNFLPGEAQQRSACLLIHQPARIAGLIHWERDRVEAWFSFLFILFFAWNK